MKVLVIQHLNTEPPATYEDVLLERGAAIHRVEIDEGESLPAWRDFDAVVVMGGPMSANDDEVLPWLTEEKRLIGEAVREGKPYWGVCLGSQLLAAGLGATVRKGSRPEVGVLPISLTEDAASDPVFAGLPAELQTFQWHGDTFDLPPGATLLARSSEYPNQAFRWGAHAYGLQFHMEVSSTLVREWAAIPEYAAVLEKLLGPGAMASVLEKVDAHNADLTRHARQMFDRWLDEIVVPASPLRERVVVP